MSWKLSAALDHLTSANFTTGYSFMGIQSICHLCFSVTTCCHMSCENLLLGKSCLTSCTAPQCAFVSALCMACLSPEVNTNRTQYETLDMNHNSYVCLTYPSDKIKTNVSHIVHCRDRPREIKLPLLCLATW